MTILSPRWTPLRSFPPAQMAYVQSPHRFNVVPAGRRSGKTERAKRKLIRRGLSLAGITHNAPVRFFAGAPTRDQAKRIFWDDLKALSRPFWKGKPSESELTIRLVTEAEIVVTGLDKPERIEGTPWDGGVLDEYANMKATAWLNNVRPALSDRNGWCDLIGVPEGRNHYYNLAVSAEAEQKSLKEQSEWGLYTWKSADVLPAKEIEAARRDLDPLTFEQEYEASFVNFAGRAYYAFTDRNKEALANFYRKDQPLILCLDFNVAPGVAVVCQELPLPGTALTGTAILGEVYIPANSNTPAVCRKLLTKWAGHEGLVAVYGDATGGSKGSAKVAGSDWDIAQEMLRKGDPSENIKGFGARVSFHVKPANPAERARVNAVNTRCCSGDGTIRLMIDAKAAPYTTKDLEGVRTLKGGSGEIDKKHDRALTHLTDALGYYIEYRFPIPGTAWAQVDVKY